MLTLHHRAEIFFSQVRNFFLANPSAFFLQLVEDNPLIHEHAVITRRDQRENGYGAESFGFQD